MPFLSAVPKDPQSSPVPISIFPSWMSPVRSRLPAPLLRPASLRAFLNVGGDVTDAGRKWPTVRVARTVRRRVVVSWELDDTFRRHSPRPLRDPRPPWCGRDGRGVQGEGQEAGPGRRGQGPARVGGSGPRYARSVRARSEGGRGAVASEH